MAYKDRTYVDPNKRGRGRFVVSEGVAPAESIQVDDALPTLLVDPVHDEFFEAVVLKGTIIAVYGHETGSGAEADDITYVAGPCIAGTTGYELKVQLVNLTDGTATWAATGTTGGATGAIAAVQYRPASGYELKGKPQGVLTMDAYRPFANAENEGVSFITHGYVEWPLVKSIDVGNSHAVIFDNTELEVGDYVMPDQLGRPVKWNELWPEYLKVGRVLAKETLGTDFDYGFLQYMQLPFDTFENALLNTVYNTHKIQDGASTDHTVSHVFGVRPNVDSVLNLDEVADFGADAVSGVVGCVRVQLIGL
jgi:hypothetical protein